MEQLWHFVKLDLFASIPEAWTVIWLTFALFGLNPRLYARKIALIAIINSVYTDLLLQILSFPLHLLNSLISVLILLFFLFPEFKAKQKLKLFVSIYATVAVTDMITVLSLSLVFGLHNREEDIQNSIGTIITGLYPTLLLEWIIIWILSTRKGWWKHSFVPRLIYGKRNGLLPILFMLLLVLCITSATILFDYSSNDYYILQLSLKYIIVVLLLFSVYGVIRVTGRTREVTAKDTQQVYIEQIGAMFTSIRGQRHDFLNHVQVMYTMLKMEKHDALKTYMADVVKETHDVREVVHHASPALAALVKAKTAIAASRGITFTYELSDHWDETSAVRMIDIVKIVGNLVTNAFDEVEKLPFGSRQVHAVIQTKNDCLELAVSNQGPPLSEEEQRLIFQPGYTTKEDGTHDGLGLSIVQERVRHYGGSLTLESNAIQGTTFRIFLPRKQLT